MHPSGALFDVFGAFVAGVFVSFTPCVYPVMPLTASFIAGANTGGTRLGAFVISLIYVLGMAVVYTALAVFAALTGKLFGQIQNTPGLNLAVGLLLIVFAFMMFDKITLPGASSGFKKTKPGDLLSVFAFGMTSGFLVGPCTAPVLGSLLVYVAGKQNILHGAILMFVFAYGVGFSLILVGTFSGLLARLPKSGAWLKGLKQFSGLVLLAAAFFFIYKAVRIFMLR
jgi:cytochrome c-type biogenesis protein